MTLILTGFLIILELAKVHPFHVSVCEIYHNDKTNALEITLKIFIDDFELSIQNRGHEDFMIMGTWTSLSRSRTSWGPIRIRWTESR